MAKAAYDGTGNSRLDGALALKAGYDTYKAIDGAGKAMAAAADGAAVNGPKGNGSAFGVSISIGSSRSKSESHEQSHSERGTSLQAENIAIKATETDLTAVGAKIEAARDVTLEAARDVKLLAATNSERLESNNQSSNVGLGVTVGFGQQSGVSFQISASQAKGKANGQETTYDNTRVTAGETLALKSGGDTTLKGAQAGGKRIEADIGGNLTIETLQDKSDYQSKQTSSGFSLSLCIPPICYGASSGSVSAAQQKIDHSYQSAVGQSGLAAGEGGFDLVVKGDTRLKGAAITSEAPEDQNRLVTRSLSYEDLTNRQKTKASSQSLALAGGFNLGSSPAGNGTPGGATTNTPAARDPMQGAFTAAGTSAAGQLGSNLLANLAGNTALPKNKNETSQTQSVISPAQITITGSGNAETDEKSRQAAQTLTGRDPATANQTLTNTLKLQDAARLEQKLKHAQQTAQAASLVGQVAAGLIGDLSTAMRKPINDANLRKTLDEKQANGQPLSNVERYELARLDKEGMTSAQAEKTLADPAARANYANWQEGSVNKIVLHGLAGVITAQVGNGNVLVGATAGAVNEALIPEMSKFLEAKGIKEGSEEYKGYMQLGSAMLGAGIGAIAGGSKTTQNAALGGTVAHNATVFNYLDHRKPNAAKLSEKERYEAAVAACASGNTGACNTRDELATLSAQRDRELQQACAGSTPDLCNTIAREAMAMGNIVYGQHGQLDWANSPESGAIRFLNVATVGAPGRPDSFHDRLAKSTADGMITATGLLPRTVLIGATTGGSLSIVGQYMNNGTVRPGEVVIDAALGAANTWAGTKAGWLGNTALGAASNAAATEIKNQYYGENNDIGFAAGVGGVFGLGGFVAGNYAGKRLQQVLPQFIYPSLNPSIPAILQPTIPNPVPGQFGTVVGATVGSGASLVPTPPKEAGK